MSSTTTAKRAKRPPTPPMPAILHDKREKLPYSFDGLAPLPTRPAHLPTGDYTVEGHTDRITVERKSHEDLFGTVGGGRDRFERELARMAVYPHAFVVVEASLTKVATVAPKQSKMLPKSVYRSILAWQIRYPAIHWIYADCRRLAEVTTFRLLERYWLEFAARPDDGAGGQQSQGAGTEHQGEQHGQDDDGREYNFNDRDGQHHDDRDDL